MSVELHETDPALLTAIRSLFDEYGPLGVKLTVEQLYEVEQLECLAASDGERHDD